MKKLNIYDVNKVNYIYDDSSGMIYEDISNLSEADSNVIEYNKKYMNNYLDNLKKYSDFNYKKFSPKQLREYFKSNGMIEMILKLTDACNMRCEYCIYSKHYPYTLTYGDSYMKFDVAKKAIDQYMEFIKEQKKVIPDKEPFIAFYGGEPLLGFETIKKVIDYVEEKYADMKASFTLTTNGLLLENDEITEYLKSKNVVICLSFDGYKENHDRNRKTVQRKPSFDRLIKLIKEKFMDYTNIYTLCCIDPKTDLEKLYDFYDKNDRFSGGIIPHVLRFTYIFDVDSDYYSEFSEEDLKRSREQYAMLRKKYIENAINEKSDWIIDLLIGQEFIRLVDRMKLSPRSGYYVKDGCCVPGSKLFVYPDGTYGICEKVCFEGVDLGNVNTGLSMENIIKQIEDYNKALEKCKDCEIANMCEVCYSHLRSSTCIGGDDKLCEGRKSHMRDMFKYIMYIESKNKGYFERKLIKQAKKNLSYGGDIQKILNM